MTIAITTLGTMIAGLIAIFQPFWLIKRRRTREERSNVQALATRVINKQEAILAQLILLSSPRKTKRKIKEKERELVEENLKEHSELKAKLNDQKKSMINFNGIDIDIENLLLIPLERLYEEAKRIEKLSGVERIEEFTRFRCWLEERLEQVSNLRMNLNTDFLDRFFKPKKIVAKVFKPE
ncbi:MAG: hypothetical protein HLX50_24570 [Alteromonadaceae bacterium]|nr:hypothetical protein [Alteromonadaceae bacterium]